MLLFLFLIFSLSLSQTIQAANQKAKLSELSLKEKVQLLKTCICPTVPEQSEQIALFYQAEQFAKTLNLNSSFPLFNKTETLSGCLYFLDTLCESSPPHSIIENRTHIIHELNQNTTIRHQLITLLKELREEEEKILLLWNQYDEYTQRMIQESQYFSKSFLKKFNTNSMLLECECTRVSLINPLLMASSPVASLLCINIIISIYEYYSGKSCPLNLSDLYHFAYDIMITPVQEYDTSTLGRKLIALLSLFATTGTYGCLIYNSIYYAQINHTIQKHILTITQALVNSMAHISSIMAIIGQHSQLQSLKEILLPLFIQISSNTPFNAKIDDNGWPIYEKIYLSKGEALTLFRQLIQTKEKSSCLFKFIGICDAHVGIAQLYAEHLEKKNTFTFALFDQENFITSQLWLIQEPEINWHIPASEPLISEQANHNEFLLAQATALALASTWGVAPARKIYLPQNLPDLIDKIKREIIDKQANLLNKKDNIL